MIDTLYLANYIQNHLNQNSFGLDFLVFAEEGDLVSTYKRNGKKITYVQGLLEILSSTIMPVKNISFHTINMQLMILADLTDAGYVQETDKNRKQSRNLLMIQDSLAELINKLNGQTTTISHNNKTYTATIGMSRPTVGQKDSLGDITEFMPLYMNISINLFENGVNTNDIKLMLNHEDIHFIRIVLSKIKTADQNNFANDKASKTFALIGGKGIDITMPMLDSEFCKIAMEDILDDNTLNRAVDVRLETPLGTSQFIGVLGNTQVTGDIGANLGGNISIVQGVEKMLKYDDNWEIIEVPAETQTKTIGFTTAKGGTVYWGDGTSDYVDGIKDVTHTYTDTTKAYKIYKFGV